MLIFAVSFFILLYIQFIISNINEIKRICLKTIVIPGWLLVSLLELISETDIKLFRERVSGETIRIYTNETAQNR